MAQYNLLLDETLRTIIWKAYDYGVFTAIIGALAIYILWLFLERQDFTPHHRLWAYLIAVTFMADTAAILWMWGSGWHNLLLAGIVPPMVVLLYFTPTAAAVSWQHPAFDSIFMLNLAAGWTIVGWAIAFAWARRSPWRNRHYDLANRLAPSAEVAASLQAPKETRPSEIAQVRQLLRHRG
jgi:Superinfection immunity protein